MTSADVGARASSERQPRGPQTTSTTSKPRPSAVAAVATALVTAVTVLFYGAGVIVCSAGAVLALLGVRERPPAVLHSLSPVPLSSDVATGAVESLRAMLRLKTVCTSGAPLSVGDAAPFAAAMEHVTVTYRELLARDDVVIEPVNTHTRLLTWRGSSPQLPPVLLNGHYDVRLAALSPRHSAHTPPYRLARTLHCERASKR